MQMEFQTVEVKNDGTPFNVKFDVCVWVAFGQANWPVISVTPVNPIWLGDIYRR